MEGASDGWGRGLGKLGPGEDLGGGVWAGYAEGVLRSVIDGCPQRKFWGMGKCVRLLRRWVKRWWVQVRGALYCMQKTKENWVVLYCLQKKEEGGVGCAWGQGLCIFFEKYIFLCHFGT